MAISKQCEHCKKDFAAKLLTSRFCSQDCFNSHRRTFDRSTRPCKHCGSDFIPTHAGGLFCSNSCRCVGRRKFDPNRTCRQCGELFVATYASKEYCSRACKGIASRKYHHIHTCPECQQTFTVKTGVDKVYCSNRCAGFAKARVRRITEWNPRVNLTCAHCNKNFEMPPSQIKRVGRGTYCSKKCSNASKVGMPGTRPFVPRILYTCASCGSQWEDYESKKNRKKYCSRVCRSIAVIQNMSKKPTSIESETYAALESLMIDFEPQYRIGYKVVDAFIPSLNTIIECLGDYFHCNPALYPGGPLNKMQTKNVTDDKRRFSTFKTQGYKVIKLWEKDIKEQGVLSLLKKLLPK